MALSTIFACAMAQAQTPSDYPTKQIRVIVPFGAGGPTDAFARIIGEELRKALGQPIVFENKPGAGTIVGTTEAFRAAPDGYTLLMVSATQTTTETLAPDKPYKLLRDFMPIAPIMGSDLAMLVHPSSPAKTLAYYITRAKASPGKLNYASSGVGSNYHMAAELLKTLTGIDIVHVPYRSSAGARSDIVAGQIEMMFDALPTVVTQVEAGALRALGTSGAARSLALPNVPTMEEAGVKGFQAVSWIGMMAPAGTPRPIVERLNVEINKVLRRPDIDSSWRKQGADPIVMSTTEFHELLRMEIERWERVIKTNGIKGE
jgi:tripartite-type tricarboxylate transporter receptor subunit TctC